MKKTGMKKLMSVALVIIMSVSLMVPAFAQNLSNDEFTPEQACQIVFEKYGEENGWVYFVADIPVDAINMTTTAVELPVAAQFQTAVNKNKGKIAVTITITTPMGKIKTASCSGIRITGDMGNDAHYNVDSSNFFAKPTIYINDMFDGLKKNVAKGTVTVYVGGGTFAGPNQLTGEFAGGVGKIFLEDC